MRLFLTLTNTRLREPFLSTAQAFQPHLLRMFLQVFHKTSLRLFGRKVKRLSSDPEDHDDDENDDENGKHALLVSIIATS